jgi:hypothetical protein
MAQLLQFRPPRKRRTPTRGGAIGVRNRTGKVDRTLDSAAEHRSASRPSAHVVGFGNLTAVVVRHCGTTERRGIFENSTMAKWAARELNYWFREAAR